MTDHNVPATDDQLPDIAASLQAELERSRASVERFQREYDELLADDDTLQEDRDSVRQMLEEARADLQAAERAIERLESDDYGRCTVCGEPIGAERLEAIPGVATCRGCSS